MQFSSLLNLNLDVKAHRNAITLSSVFSLSLRLSFWDLSQVMNLLSLLDTNKTPTHCSM